MQTSLLTNLLLLLLFNLNLHAATALATPQSPDSLLAARQASAVANQCAQYSTIANLSTIGANSTYRAAFLQASPDGTYASAAVLNSAMAQAPLLARNVDLNNACGNLTALAATAAATNFTQGIVAQFSGLPPPVAGMPFGMVILFLGFGYVIFMAVLFYHM